jgi:predicted  nucleic acid-binding Zn-ribbon protein
MDVTEITQARWGPLARARRRVGRATAPASLRAQLALVASAFLLGGVLSALLFVGVWRHTAAEGDRARQAQTDTRQALHAAQAALAVSEHRLVASRAAMRKLEAGNARMTHDLAALRKLDAVAGASLRARLQAIAVDADALTHNSAKLEAAISTLTGYIRNSSAAEIDPAYLAAQVQYLAGANARAKAAVADLAAEAARAQTSAKSLRGGSSAP